MSAHVVPKAKPTLESDSEEKTTLESQWEEEGSTTVEQGDVAEKIRALGVDPPPRSLHDLTHTGNHGDNEPTVDDQNAHQVPPLMPPVANAARLVITQGNDTGRELEIRPGKQFTIGRGLDNDFVLTDIAVSRKHFDLVHDQGAWVVVDRGSGNGTIVNGNVEDNPFMLANGDQIEIGNTVFRFEVPNGPQRRAAGYDVDVDDEELSTVAGKPLRSDPIEAATPVEQPLARLEPPTRERPKTLPPPAPMRPAPSGMPPIYGMPVPATTMPLPQMANRGPIAGPAQPTMLVNGGHVPGMLPTTLPGQGQMRPSGYPQATEIPPHSVHAQMMLIQAQQGGRLDPSTAHVPPTPYQVMPGGMQLRQYVQPQLTKKTKLLLAAAAVSALAAIVTVAILKSGGKPAQTAKSQTGSASSAATVEPIKEMKPQVAAIQPTPPTATAPTPPSTTTATPTPTPSPSTSTSTSTSTPSTNTTAPNTAAKTTTTTTATTKTTTTTPPTTTKTSPPPQTTTAAKSTPPKETRPKRTPSASSSTASTTTSAPPKRVATGGDVDAARSRAEEAYHARRFSDASSIIRAASTGAPTQEEQAKLRRQADMYLLFGKAYSHGTAPGEKPTDQYKNLQEAITYDQSLGRFYEHDLTEKLQQIAPKAATLFLANKDYKSAHTAVIKAESLGVKNNTTQFVRDQLDEKAHDLYNQALKESGNNPDSASQKARQVLEMVDTSNGWYVKAKKLIGQLAQ